MRPVLIAGAGIAGLTLALALARKGLASHVIERRDHPTEAGAGIQLGPNAMHVLRRLGVATRLAPCAGRPESIDVAGGSSGRLLGSLPLGHHIERRHGAPYWVAHRADLYAALLDEVHTQPLISVTTGFEFADWNETSDGVTARSARGAVIDGSALIGADGLWSIVRRQLFPHLGLTFSGKMAARTIIPAATASGRFAKSVTGVWLGRDAHVVHYPIRAGRDIAVVVICDEPTPREGGLADGTAEQWSGAIDGATVIGRLQRFAPELRDFLGHAQQWRTWSLYDPPPLPSWSRGRVMVIGDAAHPILPFMAQGGAMAIEMAETLASSIERSPADLSRAFQSAESLRRDRVARAQTAARSNGRIYHLTGLPGLARNLALGLVPGRLMMSRYDWLYGWNGDRQ